MKGIYSNDSGFLGAQLLVGDIRIYRVAMVMKQAHEKMKWKVPREDIKGVGLMVDLQGLLRNTWVEKKTGTTKP